ncbi:MAG TPA: hypothetical protein VHL09_02520 [Dehalococcoidia bacterium]|nr:hypothetical protein [Dehalococcoidia bacterium]
MRVVMAPLPDGFRVDLSAVYRAARPDNPPAADQGESVEFTMPNRMRRAVSVRGGWRAADEAALVAQALSRARGAAPTDVRAWAVIRRQ